jgi:colicin import membrane protein
MHYQREPSPSENLFWPVVWAVGLHALMFAMLFVSFAFAPDLPPARPVVQATLYKLQSQSQATTQTNQKIAGETKKTTAPLYETEQLEQKKAEQEKQQVAAKAAEQKKAEEARKAEAAKKADAAAKAAEQKKLADVAKKKAADEAAKKKAAEDAKKKAAEEAKKKAAAEAAKKKAADDAKKKAAEAAQRKATEDKKAAALAELLSEDVGRQQALAETHGDQVAGSLDDLIVKLVSEQWRRPPSARNGMSVEVLIEMLPDGTIINASVTRSSGDGPFDSSAVQAVRNVGRIAEMQQLDRATFDRLYRQRRAVFKPEDLGL